jgi:DedD protein
MAWFKFGKQDDSSAKTLADAPVESVESLRARAKRRLIGSLVLVLAAVIGFPLLFDTQPRPVLVDVPIEIPDKNKIAPLKPPVASSSSAPSTPAPAARVDEKASLQAKEEIVPPGPASLPVLKPNQPSAGMNSAPSATKSVANPVAPSVTEKAVADKAAADAAAKEKAAKDKATADKAAKDKAAAEAARAKALLEGKAPTPAGSTAAVSNATGERFIVQFGSFAEEGKAREARQKVERAGLKTYAQVAETSEGKRHRVRVGPFPTRAEAEKAASKIKSLDLPAAILTL